ncbi:OsmC family protein [Pseudoxanthomonas beigongshangi]
MSENPRLTVTLHQEQDFQFRVRFDGTAIPELLTDESEPLGQGAGPSPALMLTTAIANCLSASLLFAMRKFRNQPGPLVTTATTELVRNEQGRLRIGHVQVDIQLAEAAEAHQSLDRLLAQFENFCTVTESVRHGVDVSVSVRDADGVQLHGSAAVPAGA